jgi:hypothetical protein
MAEVSHLSSEGSLSSGHCVHHCLVSCRDLCSVTEYDPFYPGGRFEEQGEFPEGAFDNWAYWASRAGDMTEPNSRLVI